MLPELTAGYMVWFLLGPYLAHGSVISTANRQQRAGRDTNTNAELDVDVKTVLSSAATLLEVAENLSVDFKCLQDANPNISTLEAGQSVIVPQSCCGNNCLGSFCCERGYCRGHSTSLAPVQNGTRTCLSTITTSVSSTTSLLSGSPSSTSTPATDLSSSGRGSSSESISLTGSQPSSPSSSSLRSSSESIGSSSDSLTGLSAKRFTSSAVASSVSSSKESSTSLGTTTTAISASSRAASASTTFWTVPSSSGSGARSTNVSSSSGSSAIPQGTSSASSHTESHALSSSSVNAHSTGGSLSSLTTTSSFKPSPTNIGDSAIRINSQGLTVISQSGVAVTLPSGISTATTPTTAGRTMTFVPSVATSASSPPSVTSGDVTTMNSVGQTVISGSDGAITLSTGITKILTVTESNGKAVIFTPSDSLPPSSASTTLAGPVTTTNSAGQTVISGAAGALTLSTGTSTPTTVKLPDGSVVVFQPSDRLSSSSVRPSAATTTNFAGLTVIATSNETFTLPTGISKVTTITNSDGSVLTFSPGTLSSSSLPLSTDVPLETTTNSDGVTMIFESGKSITLPTGLTHATTVTESDGILVTFSPGHITLPPLSTQQPSSSTTPGGFIFPVTTSVPAPKATDGGTVVPCSLWFFSSCLHWGDLDIFGWVFNLPPGIRPPGPPPHISIDPKLHITLSIRGTLPDWPAITIGPDHLPTYSPKPKDGPDDGCKTGSAELCATSTSYGVSLSGAVTSTTKSQVVSTCATVYGCSVQGSSTADTTTSGCTSASTATNYYVSCSTTAISASSCTTTSSKTTTGCSVTPTTVTCGVLSPTGTAPDPACSDDLYDYVVYPKDGNDGGQVNAIQSKLSSYLSDSSKLYTSTADGLGTNYWTLPLTYNQSHEVANLTDVASINDYCGNLCTYDPTTEQNFDYQYLGIPSIYPMAQLGYLSWPRGQITNPNPERYYWHDSAGENVKVYILDTGAALDNLEFEYIKDRVNWLQVATAADQIGENDGYTGKYHGTSMLSLVAGKLCGVAKKVNPWLVRTPGRGKAPMNPEDWINGLSKIDAHLGADDSTTISAIVLLAEYFPRDNFKLNKIYDASQADGFEARAYLLMRSLVRKGAVLVTGAGNSVENIPVSDSPCDGWPANFGKTNSNYHIPSLMVLGSVDSQGGNLRGRIDYANGIPHFYGPGVNTVVAFGDPTHWDPNTPQWYYKYSSGTSDAAALTAGLSAYFLRLMELGLLTDSSGNLVENTPQAMKDFISNPKEVVWSRRSADGADRPGIWNRVDLSQSFCKWDPTSAAVKLFRRQGSSAGSCYIPKATQSASLSPSVASTPVSSFPASSTPASSSSAASSSALVSSTKTHTLTTPSSVASSTATSINTTEGAGIILSIFQATTSSSTSSVDASGIASAIVSILGDTTTSSATGVVSLSDLPTLTTGITTPAGSSCVSTAAQTDCALGPGGQTACVTTPACASWTATASSTSIDIATSTTAAPSTTPTITVKLYADTECKDVLGTIDVPSSFCAVPTFGKSWQSMRLNVTPDNGSARFMLYSEDNCLNLSGEAFETDATDTSCLSGFGPKDKGTCADLTTDCEVANAIKWLG